MNSSPICATVPNDPQSPGFDPKSGAHRHVKLLAPEPRVVWSQDNYLRIIASYEWCSDPYSTWAYVAGIKPHYIIEKADGEDSLGVTRWHEVTAEDYPLDVLKAVATALGGFTYPPVDPHTFPVEEV